MSATGALPPQAEGDDVSGRRIGQESIDFRMTSVACAARFALIPTALTFDSAGSFQMRAGLRGARTRENWPSARRRGFSAAPLPARVGSQFVGDDYRRNEALTSKEFP